MPIKKINYLNKVSITTTPLPEVNQVSADNLNEIKSVVNGNADELATATTDISEIKLQISSISAQVASPMKEFVIKPTDWNGNSYTFLDSRITPTSYQEVVCLKDYNLLSYNQRQAILNLGLFNGSQQTGQMSVLCTNIPTVDIPLTVIFRGIK